MGEYAIRRSDGQEVKIGTCECMYYCRLEDAEKVTPLAGNVDPRRDTGLFFRLPFPDEDKTQVGDYDPFERGERLYLNADPENGKPYCTDYDPDWLKEDKEPGIIQLSHRDSGLLLNVPCYHGTRLPEVQKPMQAFWNGKGYALELAYLKRTDEREILPIVRCRFCGHMWRVDWQEVAPYIHGEMRKRLDRFTPDDTKTETAKQTESKGD